MNAGGALCGRPQTLPIKMKLINADVPQVETQV
jgi:hypothetical protein